MREVHSSPRGIEHLVARLDTSRAIPIAPQPTRPQPTLGGSKHSIAVANPAIAFEA